MSDKNKKKEVLQAVQDKISKLPVGFIVGAAIGGALFLYSSKKTSTKSTSRVVRLAKLAAPYVIIALMDRMVENYDKQSAPKVVVDVEVEEV